MTGAIARTGRLATCAALILAISFASLSANPDIVVEMIATGIGAGIIVDAVVVRTLLVPALVGRGTPRARCRPQQRPHAGPLPSPPGRRW